MGYECHYKYIFLFDSGATRNHTRSFLYRLVKGGASFRPLYVYVLYVCYIYCLCLFVLTGNGNNLAPLIHCCFFFVYLVEAHMRANTQCTAKGGHETRGAGEGRTTQWGTDIKRSVEGRGRGWGTWGIQDGHYRDFQEGKQGI